MSVFREFSHQTKIQCQCCCDGGCWFTAECVLLLNKELSRSSILLHKVHKDSGNEKRESNLNWTSWNVLRICNSDLRIGIAVVMKHELSILFDIGPKTLLPQSYKIPCIFQKIAFLQSLLVILVQKVEGFSTWWLLCWCILDNKLLVAVVFP